MTRRLTILVLTLAASLGSAQTESDVRQDEKALAAFEAMTGSLWRARDHGLRELRFTFEVEILPPDRPAAVYGPFRIHWSLDGGWTLLDAEGRPDPQPEKRLKIGFTDQVVGDLVGWDSRAMIAGRSLTMPRERLLEVHIHHERPAEEQRIERIDLELDDEGRLLRQALVGSGDILLTRLRYFYETRDGRTLVRKVRRDSGGLRVLKTHHYGDVEGLSLPLRIESLNSERGREIVRYRDFEILKSVPDGK